MLIDQIKLNQLRVFDSVFRTQSMTLAANELHITQSAVSQQIKTLEGLLKIKLFDRIRQRLVPTASAHRLFQSCSASFTQIEAALEELKGGSATLRGQVSVGTPIEFGNNVLTPSVSKFCAENPRVSIRLRYDFATSMNEGILKGELDFAFVDSFSLDSRIETEPVYDEVLSLVTSPKYYKKIGGPKEDRKLFESMEYVDYQPGAPVLRLWFGHHLGTKAIEVNLRVAVMDVQGIARLILSGMGAGILPSHLISKLQKEGYELHVFKGCGKPLKNTVSVAYLPDRTLSPSSRALLRQLKEEIKRT